MYGHNNNPSLTLLFLQSFACRVKPDLHGNDTSQCAHLCCNLPISSAVKRLFLRSALHLSPLAHTVHRAFSHEETSFSAEKLLPQYLHPKDRPSGAALLFSLRNVSLFAIVSPLLRPCGNGQPCWPPQRAPGPYFRRFFSSPVPAGFSASRLALTHCLMSRYRFSVHTDTADAANFASYQDGVLPARAVAFLHVTREAQRV